MLVFCSFHLSDTLLIPASLFDIELCVQVVMFLKETCMKNGQNNVILSGIHFFWSKFQHKNLLSSCNKIFITLLPCFLVSSDDLLFLCYQVDCNMLWYPLQQKTFPKCQLMPDLSKKHAANFYCCPELCPW